MAPDLYYWGRRLTCMIAFIRDEDQRRRSVIHRARVDVVEWLGDPADVDLFDPATGNSLTYEP